MDEAMAALEEGAEQAEAEGGKLCPTTRPNVTSPESRIIPEERTSCYNCRRWWTALTRIGRLRISNRLRR